MSGLTPGAVAGFGIPDPNDFITSTITSEESVPTPTASGGATTVDLDYSSVGDTNGLFYWLGTLEGTMATPSYKNPLEHGNIDVLVDTWDPTSFPHEIADRITPSASGTRYISEDVSGQYITLSLPGRMQLAGYTLVNSFDGQNTPRSWVMEGWNSSAATPSWVTLSTHSSDTTLAHGSNDSAYFTCTEGDEGYYDKIRFRQTGANSNGNDRIVLDQMELYGKWISSLELAPLPTGMDECFYRTDNDPSSDTGGIIYWVGTDLGTTSYTNPLATSGGSITTDASTNSADSDNVGAHDLNTASGRYLSDNAANSWIEFDFDNGGGEKVVVRGFSYYPGYDHNHVFEEGELQGSNNGSDWTTIGTYDTSGAEKQIGSSVDDITNYWSVDDVTDNTQYRYIRLIQTGTNVAGNNYFSANHLEFYGAYGVESTGGETQDIAVTTISSGSTVNDVELTPGTVDIAVTDVESTTSVENIEVTSSADIALTSVASTTAVNNVEIGSTADIDLDGQIISGGTTVNDVELTPGSVDISVTPVASATSVNNVEIVAAIDIDLDGQIISETAVNDVELTPGTVDIAVTDVESTTAVNNVEVNSTTLIDLDGQVITGTTVNNVELTPGSVDISLATVSSATSVENVELSAGAVDISLSGQIIASTASVENVEVSSVTNIDLNGQIISGGTSVENIELTPGAVDINLDGQIVNNTIVFNIELSTPEVVIDLDGQIIGNDATVNNITVTPGVADIAVTPVASALSVENIELTPGPVDISLTPVSSTSTVNDIDFIIGTITQVLVQQYINILTPGQQINILTVDQSINTLEPEQPIDTGESSTIVEE